MIPTMANLINECNILSIKIKNLNNYIVYTHFSIRYRYLNTIQQYRPQKCIIYLYVRNILFYI